VRVFACLNTKRKESALKREIALSSWEFLTLNTKNRPQAGAAKFLKRKSKTLRVMKFLKLRSESCNFRAGTFADNSKLVSRCGRIEHAKRHEHLEHSGHNSVDRLALRGRNHIQQHQDAQDLSDKSRPDYGGFESVLFHYFSPYHRFAR
jgi:hypothetical protein